jgi:hypothetical protein
MSGRGSRDATTEDKMTTDSMAIAIATALDYEYAGDGVVTGWIDRDNHVSIVVNDNGSVACDFVSTVDGVTKDVCILNDGTMYTDTARISDAIRAFFNA